MDNEKFPLSYGFTAIFNSLKNRNYHGYTRLEPDPESHTQTKVILDPHTPMTWTFQSQPVDRENPPVDSLGRLLATKTNILDRRIKNSGDGKKNSSLKATNDTMDSDDEIDDKEKKNPNSMKFVGIFLAAVSGLFFTLCSVTVKLLPRIDPSEVLLFRAIVQLVLIIPIMICAKANPLGPKGVRLLVYLQGVIGCFTVTCIFIGFARLPVGDAATIIFCSPIFVMVFSHVILREHCGMFRILVIGLLLLGVILIAKPPFLQRLIFKNDNSFNTQQQSNQQDMIGYTAALFGTLLTASNFVCMRRLREVHFSVLIFAFSLMSAAMSAAFVGAVTKFKLPTNSEEWMYAVLVGVFGLSGQSLLAIALRYETAGVVSVTRSMDIAVAYIIQITWFSDIPLWTSILGAFVVILAVFTMAMEEAFLSLLKNIFGSSGWC